MIIDLLFSASFLDDQYYAEFRNDPEVPYLREIGLLTARETDLPRGLLPSKVLKQRLVAFLEVFSSISNPRQLFRYDILFHYFVELLSKSDLAVSKLAFECVARYKVPGVGSHRDSINRLLDEKTIREELVKMQAYINDGAEDEVEEKVRMDHRKELIPILLAIIFGRIASKSGGNRSAKEHFDARY